MFNQDVQSTHSINLSIQDAQDLQTTHLFDMLNQHAQSKIFYILLI